MFMTSNKGKSHALSPDLKAKHRQLSEVLKSRIAALSLKPGDKFLSVREIAEKYDVSMLTSYKSIQELVAQNLLVARQSRGYFIAAGAESLQAALGSPMITVLAPESYVNLDIVPEGFIRGIRERIPLARVSLEFLPPRDVPRFLDLHLAQRHHLEARGYVLRSVDRQIHDFFTQHQIPAVITGYRDPQVNLPVVARDERQIANSVTRFLLNKGHQRIAYMEWERLNGGLMQRIEGYTSALLEAKAVPSSKPDKYLLLAPFNETETMETFRTMLDSTDPPTALILGNEQHSAWILKAVHQWKLRVPRDIALVCLAGGTLTDNLIPRLTCVPRNDYEVGAWVGHFLSKLLAGDSITETEHLLPSYVKEYETT